MSFPLGIKEATDAKLLVSTSSFHTLSTCKVSEAPSMENKQRRLLPVCSALSSKAGRSINLFKTYSPPPIRYVPPCLTDEANQSYLQELQDDYVQEIIPNVDSDRVNDLSKLNTMANNNIGNGILGSENNISNFSSGIRQRKRLPFWSYAKLFFNCWLVLPRFNGAAHVYEHFVRPMIVNQQVVNIWYIPKKGEPERPDDVISAAQKYIEQNGSKAFENLVNKFKSSNPRRSILEEVEVERRARVQRESEAREVNPFFNPDYRY